MTIDVKKKEYSFLLIFFVKKFITNKTENTKKIEDPIEGK
tara:strand:+ start:266 stop:385 length:120 start_codon:yes stop_codon:yes gene_type:complete